MFKCDVCNDTFDNTEQLLRHILTTHNNSTHQCEVCNENFINITNLITHIFESHHTKNYEPGHPKSLFIMPVVFKNDSLKDKYGLLA